MRPQNAQITLPILPRPRLSGLRAGLGLGLSLCLASAACDSAGDGNILEVQAEAVVSGVVFFDVNGTRELDGPDRGADVEVALVLEGTTDTIAHARTGSTGEFEFANVPVGQYRVVVAGASLADSIGVVYRDPPGEPVQDHDIGSDIPADERISGSGVLTVGMDDTASVELGVGYPRASVEEVRALAEGRKVVVRALALTQIGEFGDTSLYLMGDSLSLRTTRVDQADILPGDSVHVIGTTAIRNGLPVLNNTAVFFIEEADAPQPVELSAREAVTADGGRYDAALVTVEGLTVVDTTTVGGRLLIATDDEGSAGLDILVHQDGSFDFADYAPGTELNATGILVPTTGSGAAGATPVWQLRPRNVTDLEIQP